MGCFGGPGRRRVVAVAGGRRVGVVADTYQQFVDKCFIKFDLNKTEEVRVYLEDGTEVDCEYYEYIPSGTDLHLHTPAPATQVEALAAFIHKCLDKHPPIHDRVTDALGHADPARAMELLALLTKVAQAPAAESHRGRDCHWFKGLDTKFRTKEEVLRNSAETRVRAYLDGARRDLMAAGTAAASAVDYFRQRLKSCRYNGNYFDRGAGEGSRLCDSSGLFECEGAYDQNRCEADHFINPYASREARIVFSTWNLDHVIEKSRTVLPTLKKALDGPNGSNVNLPYFYNLLFQHKNKGDDEGNLKLVHIACHVKRPHEDRCDPEKVFVKPRGKSKETTNGSYDDVRVETKGSKTSKKDVEMSNGGNDDVRVKTKGIKSKKGGEMSNDDVRVKTKGIKSKKGGEICNDDVRVKTKGIKSKKGGEMSNDDVRVKTKGIKASKRSKDVVDAAMPALRPRPRRSLQDVTRRRRCTNPRLTRGEKRKRTTCENHD